MVNAVCSRLSTHDAPFPHLRPLPLAPYVCGWMQKIITDNYARENTSEKKDEVCASLSGTFIIPWNIFGCWR